MANYASKSGTLAGSAVDYTNKTTDGISAKSIAIVNKHATNTYTFKLSADAGSGKTIPIAPSSVRILNKVPQLDAVSIDGTGAYEIIVSDEEFGIDGEQFDVDAAALSTLALTSAGDGASLVGVQDAAAHLAAADVEAALLEILKNFRTVDLVAGAEAADVIAVTVNVETLGAVDLNEAILLECRLYDENMIESLAAAFAMAETGDGSEVSNTAQAAMLIRTDANGAATISVTDVVGASGASVNLIVTPITESGVKDIYGGAPARIEITFD